ncbi:MBL fold metallo-hydrolase [Victivallis sp. Marseille-Q1083]|uniref:MBL fold metallo-hydrolase n=1 Tax=Victivallis sp. Marseille-Q1083 TaxID=2717288 RepID=UPI0015883E7B|nr:MBL fold metallo-hydrolase [Victivallis sp. Marseille-Q1083]
MKLLICGSAAAEGVPGLFCGCRVCQHARQHGGKDLRFRTAYQLGDAIRVDAGADYSAQEIRFRLHSERLKHLFITHSHEDHFYPENLTFRLPGMSAVPPGRRLTLYGNRRVLELVREYGKLRDLPDGPQLDLQLLTAFEPVELPAERWTVTPLPATHAPAEEAFFFSLEQAGRRILIANDTGYFAEAVWRHLAGRGYDLVILDCCYGLIDFGENHLGGKMIFQTVERLKAEAAIQPEARVIVNHFSHNCLGTHAELEAFFRPAGIEVGYDGLEISW